MTISPPSNVKLAEGEPARVLASGIDTLVLAVDVTWERDLFLSLLAGLKETAKATDKPVAGEMKAGDEVDDWPFAVSPHGSKGYEWILTGREFTLKVGKWLTPGSRPSVMAEFRSEALWHHGPQALIDRVCSLVRCNGGRVESLRSSRADLCVDVLVPEAAWHPALDDSFITRAVHVSPHKARRKLTGFSVGRGVVSARLYDKPLEIREQSGKEWMFDVWGIDSVPDGHRVIRVEFQVRREAIKDLGVSSAAELLALAPNLWAYCTREWLKVQDDPKRHHTQQHTLPWWTVVQEGFRGAQGACPLIRAKAIRVDERKLLEQLFGNLTSIAALANNGVLETGELVELSDVIDRIERKAGAMGLDDMELTDRVRAKLAKFHRGLSTFREACRARVAAGLVCEPQPQRSDL